MWASKRAVSDVLRFAVLLGAAAFWVQFGFAQFTSSVEGTVTDASQAAVPEAQVTLTNQLTQVVHRTTTSEAGFFRILQLPPGAYRLEVRREGFRTWVENDLILEGSQARTVYPVLAVGEQAAR
ncbi:MAG TPA: carboxypeptidase-like regulatory domain-containing protein, partial [Bryobacterales bacterium]|nr:carboxypeptidase-like regulatory domain-containing protein [Bryobacterales bacterium]